MSAIRLSDEQRLDWLRLIRSERIGPRTFRALLNQHGGAGAALDALPDVARKAGRGALRIASVAEATREMEALARLGGRFVAQGEPDYPKPLLAADTSPPLIAVRGSLACLVRPSIAIVGSRNASAVGGAFADRLAAELGRAGFTVVSGLARGIDTRAHKAACPSGTVAVLAGGHDRVYPEQNLPLLDRILEEGGAVVSEMPMGWEPRGRDFPRRNRIVSGLCLGVIVVEAARRSGSLITARFALEQGREVFAVPGSPLDPRAEGTNDLIRNGATLCAEVDHVLSVLAPTLDNRFEAPGPDEDLRRQGEEPAESGLWDELFGTEGEPSRARPELYAAVEPFRPPADGSGDDPANGAAHLLSLLGAVPVAIDELARQAELPIRDVHAILMEFDLEGRILRHGGNAVSLVS